MEQKCEQSTWPLRGSDSTLEVNRQDMEAADHIGINELSSDSCEQNNSKKENVKATHPTRRARADSVRQNRKIKVKNDTSHRDIEKRRRDRINRSLWMLKDLVPAAKDRYGSKSGRLEKAELLELTVEYLRLLNKDIGVESTLSVITPVETEYSPETENSNNGNSLPQDLYVAGFKDGVLEVLSQLKKNSFLSDFQAHDIVSRVHTKDGDGNVFNLAQVTGVMDALGLPYDRNSPQQRMVDDKKPSQQLTHVNNMHSMRKPVDVDSGCQGMSDEGNEKKIIPHSFLTRKRRHNTQDSYESDSFSSDNSSDRSCTQKLSPKRHLSYATDNSETSKGNSESDAGKSFAGDFQSFISNSSFVASHGTPLLLPAYALHSSGSRYVPVVLPPAAIFHHAVPNTSHCVPVNFGKNCEEEPLSSQPPVLIRNSEIYNTYGDQPNVRSKSRLSDQEYPLNLSSAPTSVISVGRSSDSCSDEELDRKTSPLSCVKSQFTSTVSNASAQPKYNPGENTFIPQANKLYNMETKCVNHDRSHSTIPREDNFRVNEHCSGHFENQLNIPDKSVRQYWHNRYTVKGLY